MTIPGFRSYKINEKQTYTERMQTGQMNEIKARPLCLLIIVSLFVTLLGGCKKSEEHDIIILFTNDVHCGVEDDIGCAGLAAYKKSAEGRTPYTALVDCGDSIQGDIIGTVSEGKYPAELMKQTGYDFAVPGNHEFDYGMEQLAELMELSGAQYTACNLRYTGDGVNPIEDIQPYITRTFGDTKVAFVGICTPESITSSEPSSFMDENGEFVYDFYGGNNGTELYEQVQKTVDECRENGAEYVIALAHLGISEQSEPFRSIDVIQNTSGIDAVLDGHSHSVIPCRIEKNKLGEEVPLSSTGTKLNNIGQLVITSDGIITVGLISDYPEKDGEMEEYIGRLQSEVEADMERVVAKSEVALLASENGIRLVRNRETAIGDFCADAFRELSGADIALMNGGGIRADLPEGEIKYGDIISVMPYGNTLCAVKAKGSEILDALEMASCYVLPESGDGEKSVGENGGFLQVSGLKYTIDTSISSTVQTDENGMFVSAGENRRVKDVQVLEDGKYVPLEPDKTYTVASHNYLIKEGGDGLNMFMDNELVIDEAAADYAVLITYITDKLGGAIGDEYVQPQGRIIVI